MERIPIVLIFIFVSCVPKMVLHEKTPQKLLSYLALGDSYTIGESVSENERYPVLLSKALQKKGIPLDQPKIIATTGWTTTRLSEAIDQADISDQVFDLVSLLIGVNDQYQGKPFAEYEPRFRKLLSTAIHQAGGNQNRVIVLSIPDYAYTPFGQKKDPARISRELDAYNRVNARIAREMGVRYFDITPISREGLKNISLVASDGLHPSGEMYAQWVDLMIRDVSKMLVRKN